MKPMLLIVTAIVAFGSIVARGDAIDTEHLFGFTTNVGITCSQNRAAVVPNVGRLISERDPYYSLTSLT